MAISSTPPPSATAALLPKAAPAGGSTAKLPGHAAGTPVYPPQSLPGKAPANPAQPARVAAAAGTAAAPATAAPTAAPTAAAGETAAALAQASAPDDDAQAADEPQAQTRASAPAASPRARARTSVAARPGTPGPAGTTGMPSTPAEPKAGETTPPATDATAAGAETARESPPEGRPGAEAAPAARADANPDPAPMLPTGPVLPLATPMPVSADAVAASPIVTPAAAAALPVAAARIAAVSSQSSAGTTSTEASPGLRSPADDTAADPGQAGADAATLLSDPSNVRGGATSAGATAAPTVHTEVGAGGWTEEVGTHLVWMAHQGVTDASLRLQPEHLGPLEVKISLHDSDASVWFGASAPATRAALEQALPQLKEMFAAQGMTLTDAGVSRESARDPQYAPRQSPSGAAGTVQNATPVSAAAPRRGLIDTYA